MERLTLDEAIKHAKEVAKTNRAEATYNFPNLKEYYDNCAQRANQYDQLAEWLEELKSYKDAEEQGLLVRLPANNKEIYIISSRWTVCSECGSRFDEYSCSGCEYECDSKKEYYVCPTYLSSINVNTYVNRFGKTVFLTREEAEKKLEEMKNND
jgi:hypothetical protein